jgi:hypothetical protein
MNENRIKNDGTRASRSISTRKGIPIDFSAELPLRVPIKIQPQYSMSQPSVISEKTLLPALFQIAARFDNAKMPAAVRSILTLQSDSLPEKMLNHEKLDGILKAIAKRKKTARR